MPQEFCALKCFSCNTFQVHIVKKSSKKWTCKMCGENQTVIKVFGQGTAKDCREHIQKLNMMMGIATESQSVEDETNEKYEKNEETRRVLSSDSEKKDFENDQSISPTTNVGNGQSAGKVSKWACFLDSDTE